jgi:hypothetical protein
MPTYPRGHALVSQLGNSVTIVDGFGSHTVPIEALT